MVQASIAVLEAKGWPREEFANLIMGTPEIEQERVIARQRLIEALPDAARALLYRLSIIVGQMDRGLALAVAEVAPLLERPGEALERLIGPWLIGWPETSFGCRRWSLMRGSRCWAQPKLWPFGIRSSDF